MGVFELVAHPADQGGEIIGKSCQTRLEGGQAGYEIAQETHPIGVTLGIARRLELSCAGLIAQTLIGGWYRDLDMKLGQTCRNPFSADSEIAHPELAREMQADRFARIGIEDDRSGVTAEGCTVMFEDEALPRVAYEIRARDA